jgi:hypothetical protein
MLVIVAGMAVGVIFGRKPITGSCGGMKALGLDVECEICGGDADRCESAVPIRAESGIPESDSTTSYYRAPEK